MEYRQIAALLVMLMWVGGCAHHIIAPATRPALAGLVAPFYNMDVLAMVDPPSGWHAEPLKGTSSHKHQVWLSPSGSSAYGVIHFKMPLPVGEHLAMDGFIKQMRKTEGDATLISQQDDEPKDGIRFVAEGGLYRIRGFLTVSGWEGWASYAGTLRNAAVVPDELMIAEAAREHTVFGHQGD